MRAVAPVVVPAVAILLGTAILAGTVLPWLLPAVAVAAPTATAAAVLARRRSFRLRLSLVLAAAWLAAGLAGAWVLQARPKAGTGWVLVVLFALPLPVFPWLYAGTSDQRKR